MKKPPILIYALLCALALMNINILKAQDPGPPSGNGIEPLVVAGNPDCADIGYSDPGDFSYKPQPEPPPSGVYPYPGDLINALTLDSDGVFFNWASDLRIEAVIVKGGSNANVYHYAPADYSDTDLHSPINLNNDQPYAISHIEVCYGYNLDIIVSDPPQTSYTRTFDWDINKSVEPDNWSFFKGDKGTSNYLVSVEKTGFTDSDWSVDGVIHIENNTPFDATIESIENMISGIGPITIDCGISFPYILESGESVECTYSTGLPDGLSRVNTVSVMTSGVVEGGESSENITFGDPTETVNNEINVTDSNGMTWGPVSNNSSWDYPTTYSCNTHQGMNNNTATIDETGQNASASVEVTCYELVVDKTALTAFDRTWNWTINKQSDVSDLTLTEGQSFMVNYEVEINIDSTDSDWNASGNITVNNPHPTLSAVLDRVEDLVPDGFNYSVNCPDLVVPAGGSVNCIYSVELPDATDRNNIATAVLNNNSYDENGLATPDGKTGFDGSAAVSFDNATITNIDEEIEVTDIMASDPDAIEMILGIVDKNDVMPVYFNYSYVIQNLDCSLGQEEVTFTNEAVFNTTDSPISTGMDDASVLVHLACGEGCTLTPGYWKTHSEHGPAPYDANWQNVGPLQQDELFFINEQTYYEVLWTPPAGNSYYILARAYIAAYLNVLNGASLPQDVSESMEWAVGFFTNTTPDETARLKGKNKKNIVDNARVLDDYNNGEIGPGHCDEDDDSDSDGNRLSEEFSFDEHLFLVYPNPAEDVFTIEVSLQKSTKGLLIMYDQLGRIIYTEQVAGLDNLIHEVDVIQNKITPGFYFISLKTNEGTYAEKISIHSTE